MATAKTDDFERDEVISWYEEKYEIKLARINRRKRTVLRDEKGRLYCFLVAREELKHFHGLDPEILSNEKKWTDGMLVIGIRHYNSIRIYQADMDPLLQREPRNGKFHTVEKGGLLYVKEAPEYALARIGEASIAAIIRTALEKAKKDPEHRAWLMELLQNKLTESA